MSDQKDPLCPVCGYSHPEASQCWERNYRTYPELLIAELARQAVVEGHLIPEVMDIFLALSKLFGIGNNLALTRGLKAGRDELAARRGVVHAK